MASTHVAFLRAINLGPNRKFPKDAILTATEAAGFTDVATHINTGNVGFTTRMRSRARIEGALERAYAADRGFEVPTIVFTAAELRAIVADADELTDDHAGRHYVTLMKQPPAKDDVRALAARAGDGEQLVVRDRVAHLLIGESFLDAVLPALVEKVLGVGTNRNATVIRAVSQKWCS